MLLRIEGRDLRDAASAAWELGVEPFTTKHGERTHASLGLANAKGNPVTARILPPAVEWTAG